MREFVTSTGTTTRDPSRPVPPSPARPLIGIAGCVAVAAGLVAGCEAPKIGAGDCRIECRDIGDCPDDMNCLEGRCVHTGRVEACGAAGAGAGREAGAPAGSGTGGVAGTGTAGSGREVGGTEETGGSTEAPTGGLGGSGGNVGGTGGSSTVGGGAGEDGSVGGSGGNVGGGNTGGAAGGPGGAATGGAGAGGCTEPASIPVIDEQELAPACLGEVYSVTLTATGGGDHSWSSDLPEDSWLELSDQGVLSGVVANTREFSFDVTVEDTTTGCASEPQRFTLVVRGETATECPTIYITDMTTASPAPASCRDWPYFAALTASGGSSTYTWEALETPPGLEFHSLDQTVTGTATGSGTLTVQVTYGEEQDRIVHRSFPVPAREKCWFGYISNGSGAPRLNLVDPLLVDQLPSAHLQWPTSDSTGLSVEDFQFSPDGRFVAVRAKDASDVYTLWLWQGPRWDREQPLDLDPSSTDESVAYYAWSGDGSVLAAAFDTGSDTLLGGVDVTGVPDNPTVGGIQGLLMLEPRSAPVDSDVTWYGENEHVAFHSTPNPNEFIVSHTSYGTGGFQPVTTWPLTYAESPFLYSGNEGYFVGTPTSSILDFFAVGDAGVVSHGNVAIDPVGAFVAYAEAEQLLVYRATEPSLSAGAETWASTTSGCSNLLTWAPQRERLVCLDTVAGVVQIHDLDELSRTIVTAPLLDSETYAASTWQGSPRLISPSGDRIALTTTEHVYMGDLGGEEPEMVWSSLLSEGSAPVELSFSPDERVLMTHHGTYVELYETGSGDWVEAGYAAVTTEECQDSGLAQPDWCGRQRDLSQPVWSGDSQLLALVLDPDGLVVLDLRPTPLLDVIDAVQVDPNCGAGCVGTGQFQP